MSRHLRSFRDFYPFYLGEHSNKINRILHFTGTSFAILTFIMFMITFSWIYLILTPIFGYSLSWIGHFVFQKNVPATFQAPLYSLMGDFKMWFELITGAIPFDEKFIRRRRI